MAFIFVLITCQLVHYLNITHCGLHSILVNMILFTHIFGADISCVHRLVNDPQDPNESSKNSTIQWFSFKN